MVGKKPGFPEGDKLEVEVKNGRWVLTRPGGAAAGGRAGTALFQYQVGDAVAGCDAVTVTMSPVAVETGNGVADQKAERLGGASLVGRRRLRVA